jgi:hypothetical protein
LSAIEELAGGNIPPAPDSGATANYYAPNGNPAEIIQIPGIPPIATEVLDDVEMAIDVIEIIQWLFAPEALTPWGAIIELVLLLIEQLFPLFVGRPRPEATLTCAQNLMRSRNSAGTLAGTLFSRALNDWNIVISESGPGEAIIGAIVHQFVYNLIDQNIPARQAREIVLLQMTQGANAKNVLAPRLRTPVAQDTKLYGPQGFQRVYQKIVDHLVKQGMATDHAHVKALKLALRYLPFRWIVRLGLNKPLPPPPTKQPGGKPPPPPGGEPPPKPPGPQLEQCCQEIQGALGKISSAIAEANVTFTAPDPSPAIAAAGNEISQTLANAAQALADSYAQAEQCICDRLAEIRDLLTIPAGDVQGYLDELQKETLLSSAMHDFLSSGGQA